MRRGGDQSGLESLAARILTCLRTAVLSKADLARVLGHSSILAKLNLRVTQLLDRALIERTLPDEPNSRLQKYRLTEVGRKLTMQG